MGKTFTCIKDGATWRGRQIRLGETITVRDEVAKSLDGHPCWQGPADPDKAKGK